MLIISSPKATPFHYNAVYYYIPCQFYCQGVFYFIFTKSIIFLRIFEYSIDFFYKLKTTLVIFSYFMIY